MLHHLLTCFVFIFGDLDNITLAMDYTVVDSDSTVINTFGHLLALALVGKLRVIAKAAKKSPGRELACSPFESRLQSQPSELAVISSSPS